MAKIQTNTSAFTIAHFIFLFLVIFFCIAIIAWTMIRQNNSNPTNDITGNILHLSGSQPCISRTIKTVQQMWEYNPKAVPEKYWEIAMNYMNQRVQKTTYGLCQDIAFVCKAGDILHDCNPCAVPLARDYAQQAHIADMIMSNCGVDE